MNAKELHKKNPGKLEVIPTVPLETREDLSLAYTPGVAEVCLEIAAKKAHVFDYTIKQNTIAIVTDGSAVLGLGNIGPEAALPVMEGKAALFKKFANVDAFPICLNTQDTEEIIKTIRNIAPVFGGINLEDISAPRCFEIEKRLIEDLDIPVFHDDQHGTAIVVLAALINALKVVKKDKNAKIIVSGAGAAGTAIANILRNYGFYNTSVCDSQGLICTLRTDVNEAKANLNKISNPKDICGPCTNAIKGADVFIGTSAPDVLTKKDVRGMAEGAIIFALANPIPEINPGIAKKAGAKVIATGRSDYPNQINNVLAFPGIFRGALDAKIKIITEEMKLEAALALANMVKNPDVENIIPSVFDNGVSKNVANAVRKIARKERK
ncbi:TPA: NAD-dependent malic enzyme [candidate division CPR2 bacterium]|uniref:Malate dehydrogenase (Oxaloacetate-decarboxylating) n=1 Tax=candidate division CPR2 bacterium GW2011_GWC1_41_48 TaxID=1618344 RepID=A0A0G0Z6V5_UNCC2|nr:MAG: Malate dehydrogenase (Oxaloacetate-decarboxylating) [candidate division CPR2 bacterium GW2011_GWC2_39_35]KKR28251.1 MAG: Malate dehydrogenase (Oxaloacetate-decarboxylating) [candidate division CPR2 bacterium GW2011_GWD2_39_7]KKS08748.1 MAG: Malate dehydrogenase (Oxaloacetate-decarboxylating) [candidate division CPR2 bacterium GW2011_GWC1_41_48]OGB72423.1 MAG: malate dehydrogenase [candidate division CPR2 bacterium GWD2_39_7]HBG81215.1 NAD-dependent malic enzyme [candidate division CPR2 